MCYFNKFDNVHSIITSGPTDWAISFFPRIQEADDPLYFIFLVSRVILHIKANENETCEPKLKAIDLLIQWLIQSTASFEYQYEPNNGNLYKILFLTESGKFLSVPLRLFYLHSFSDFSSFLSPKDTQNNFIIRVNNVKYYISVILNVNSFRT